MALQAWVIPISLTSFLGCTALLRRISHFFGRYPIVLGLIPILLFASLLLGQRWAPVHDTLLIVMWGHSFFSNLFLAHDPSLWFPLMDWGKNINLFYLAGFHPTFLFLAPLLKIFPALNLLTLFYLSMVLDEILLLGGVFALGRLIYKNTSSTIFVAISLVGASIWCNQVGFNFHLYYALPLCLYLLMSGAQTGVVWKLLVGGIVLGITCSFGMGIYSGIADVLYCIPFLVACFCYQNRSLRDWLHAMGKAEWLALAGLCLTLVLPLVFMLHPGLPALLSPGRASGGAASYDNFLGNIPRLETFSGILDGLINLRDITAYSGMLIIPLALFGLSYSRSYKQVPFLAGGLFLFLFYLTKDSFVAPFLFYVPGMRLFRHIPMVVPLIKMTLVVLAGFGFDKLVETLKKPYSKRTRTVMLAAFLWVTPFVLFFLSRWASNVGGNPQGLRLGIIHLAVFILFILLLSRGKLIRKSAPALLILLAVIDVYSFRASVFHERLVPISEEFWDLFKLRAPVFVDKRLRNYFDNENFSRISKELFGPGYKRKDLQLSLDTDSAPGQLPYGKWGGSYNALEAFLGFDPCQSNYRTDSALPAVAQLLPPSGEYPSYMYRIPLSAKREGLKRAIGCEFPKLQVFRALSVFPTTSAASQFMLSAGYDGRLVASEEGVRRYLEKGNIRKGFISLEDPKASYASASTAFISRIRNYSHGHLSLELTTPRDSDSYWLYFADAWHPFWKATLDGKEAPVLQADVAFKAVRVPAGKSVVDFVYSSTLDNVLLLLLWLEAGAFVVCVFVYIFRREIWLRS